MSAAVGDRGIVAEDGVSRATGCSGGEAGRAESAAEGSMGVAEYMDGERYNGAACEAPWLGGGGCACGGGGGCGGVDETM